MKQTKNFQDMKNAIIKIAFALVLMTISQSAMAQFKIGLRAASPSISSQETYKKMGDSKSQSMYGLSYLSTQTSFSYGLGLYNEIGKNAWLMGEVLYRKETVEYSLEMLNAIERAESLMTDEHNVVSFQLAAGLKYKDFKLGLGPVFNYRIDSDYSLDNYEGFTVEDNQWKPGFQFNLGYVIKDHIHIDLKKEISFFSVGDEYNISGKDLRLNKLPHNLYLSFGIFL